MRIPLHQGTLSEVPVEDSFTPGKRLNEAILIKGRFERYLESISQLENECDFKRRRFLESVGAFGPIVVASVDNKSVLAPARVAS